MTDPVIRLKRVYEKPAKDDGFRILVDRLWPRGVSKTSAHVDAWLKDVAPSPALRTWFGHDPERWTEFRRRYFDELKQQTDAVDELRKLIGAKPATFVYAARDPEHTHALALKDFIERAKGKPKAAKKSGAATKRPPAARRKAARPR